MPAKSKAQRRWAFWAMDHPRKAGVRRDVAAEFTKLMPGAPERVKKKKHK